MKKLIAITGIANSGKDTCAHLILLMTGALTPDIRDMDGSAVNVARFLNSCRQQGFIKINGRSLEWEIGKFAWPLYQTAAILLDEPNPIRLMTDAFKRSVIPAAKYNNKHFSTGREFLQYLGTVMRACISDTIWMDRLVYRWRVCQNMIITDLRYPEPEEQFIRVNDGIVIHMERGSNSDTHHSETGPALISYGPKDATINNNYELDVLIKAVGNFCRYNDLYNCKYDLV